MVKHNNVVPNRHFHKDWQVGGRCAQPPRKNLAWARGGGGEKRAVAQGSAGTGP